MSNSDNKNYTILEELSTVKDVCRWEELGVELFAILLTE